MSEQIIYRSELMGLIEISKSQINRLVAKGRFPKPDLPGRAGHSRKFAKEPGWDIRRLPEDLKFKIQNAKSATEGTENTENECLKLEMPKMRRSEEQIGPGPPVITGGDVQKGTLPIHLYSGRAREIAARRMEAVTKFRAAAGSEGKRAAIAIWNAENSDCRLSMTSLYRFDRAHRDEGMEGLIPRWGGRESSTSTVPEAAFRDFCRLYLVQQKPGAAEVHNHISHLHPGGIPSISVFMRRLYREYPKQFIYLHREGPQAYDRKYASYIARDYYTVAPGQIYCMDHHQIDVAVMDERDRPIFPWATVCMDVRSRKYVGWCLCAQPNSDTIHLAFRRACLRHGVPGEIYIDNGKDFRSRLFAGGARKVRLQVDENATRALVVQLGVRVHYAIPYNAKSKPIERSFLTIKERFSRLLPTFRGGTVTERPEELQKIIDSGAIVPIGEFEKLYAGFVEASYNEHPHRGHAMDGRTPNQVFAEGCVARPVDEENLSLLLLRSSKPIKVGKNGVTFCGRIYFADQLLMMKGEWVYLRYDPGQIGRVWAYSSNDEYICQAKENELLAWGATDEQYHRALAIKKKEKNLIRSYRVAEYDRSVQPDVMKAVMIDDMRKKNINLTMDDIEPEKPLLAAMRVSVRERERLMEEEEDARRKDAAEFLRYDPPREEKEDFFDDDFKKYMGVI